MMTTYCTQLTQAQASSYSSLWLALQYPNIFNSLEETTDFLVPFFKHPQNEEWLLVLPDSLTLSPSPNLLQNSGLHQALEYFYVPLIGQSEWEDLWQQLLTSQALALTALLPANASLLNEAQIQAAGWFPGSP